MFFIELGHDKVKASGANCREVVGGINGINAYWVELRSPMLATAAN
jgi:hypothetical protein